ncbi:MAG: GAF domain-containing protein [Bacteroidia bacterium]|nr:GAF domain-containing protein [Bacteroidia bacterium]MDW8345383.1 GAF domain-containing protein [Bacteroidia bacterium]
MKLETKECLAIIQNLLNEFVSGLIITDNEGQILTSINSLSLTSSDIESIISTQSDLFQYTTTDKRILKVQKHILPKNNLTYYLIKPKSAGIQKDILSQFFNQLPVGVLIQTLDRKTFLANDIAVNLLGEGIIDPNKKEYPLYAEYTNDLYDPKQLPMTLAAQGKKNYANNIQVLKNNLRIPLEVISAPIYNEQGQIEYLIAIFRDVSHQKAIEKELQVKTEELLTSNEELSQNLEELRTTQEFMRIQTERLLRKNNMVNRFQTSLNHFTKNTLPKIETIKQAHLHLSSEACKELNISQCSIWKYNPSLQELELETLYSHEVQTHLYLKYTLTEAEHPYFFEALHTQDILVISNVLQHVYTRTLSDTYYKQMGLISVMVVPLFQSGMLMGCICYEQNGNIERSFEPEERYFAKSIADLLILTMESIHNKKIVSELKILNEQIIAQDEELRQSLEELQSAQESLYILNNILHQKEQKLSTYNSTLSELTLKNYAELNDLIKVLQNTTELTSKAMKVERVSVWKLSEDNEKISCIDLYWNGKHEAGLDIYAKDYPNYFRCLFYQDAIVADDARYDPQTQEFRDTYLKLYDIYSMLDYPIRLRGKTIGVICCEQVGRITHWELEDQTFLKSVANFISLTFEADARQQAENRLKSLLS